MPNRLAALALALLLAACASPAPAPPAETAPPPTAAAVPAAEATELSPALHWSRNSAERRALFLQTFRDAADALEDRVEGRDPFTWVVVIDADETLLDNSLYQKEREAVGLGFTTESWNAWVRRQDATALPGAREFLEAVRGLGGRIAVVTNRGEEVCGPTAANLATLRLPHDVVLCKPVGGPSDKAPRWRALEAGTADRNLPPLEIVMWIGDNIQDFPGGEQALADAEVVGGDGSGTALDRFGRDFFLLPNPMYGSWEDNPHR